MVRKRTLRNINHSLLVDLGYFDTTPKKVYFKAYTLPWIWEIVKKYARKAEINKHIHPHLFRHQILTYLGSYVFIGPIIPSNFPILTNSDESGSPYKAMQVWKYRPVLLCKYLVLRHVLPEAVICNLLTCSVL